ncbi:MAG TPA: hypothetical protein VNZ22_05035, partial [Bacillota bacterium]|nr:hypothetical protein [Bacillota bacterium]
MQSSGFAKVARSIDSMPQVNYDMADVAGLLYRNPLLEARLARYPAFLGLAEEAEFVSIGNDAEFTKLWQQQRPVAELVGQSQIQALRNNPEAFKRAWNTVAPDVNDLRTYLETGRSSKYDPIKILGRWKFDVNAAISARRRANPNLPSSEMQKIKKWMQAAFEKTELIARTDNQLALRNLPPLKPGAAAGAQNLQGQWKDLDGKYQLAFPDKEMLATVEGERLAVKADGTDLVFTRED